MIADAAARLRNGRTTSAALIDESLAAIARQNEATRAFITVDAAGARHAAAAADRERTSGIDRGPLHGIPISIKDIIDQAGVVTTAASHVLDDRVAPADALVVSRLKEAGAVILGRNNLHQFALGTTSDDSAYGAVRNPHDLARVAGGSSGGSAVAVATGMGMASVGTDTGASIRVPASLCGVVGLKGTLGDVPTHGVLPLSSTLDHVGPIATTVQDVAWMWQIMSGRPATLLTPARLSGRRIGRLSGYFDEVVAPDVRLALESAAHALAAAGVETEAATILDADAIARTYADIVLSEGAFWHRSYLDQRASGYLPGVHARLSQGRHVLAGDYLDALARRARLQESVDDLFDRVDLLLLPTLPITAPPVGASDVSVLPDAGPLPVRAVMLRLTQLFNITGHPAISLPIPVRGLPVGLQLVGRRGDTAGLLAAAAACEAVLASLPMA